MARILLVCTGNICRTPMAEGFLRESLQDRVVGDEQIEVGSAGTVAWEGSLATPDAVAVARELGADISKHLARQLTQSHVEGADLVLGMAAEHRDFVEQLVPEAAWRTFTLKELVRLVEALPRSGDDGSSSALHLRRRIVEAGDLRADGFEGTPNDESVADPIGLSEETYRAVAWELQAWCARLVDGLVGPPARPDPPGEQRPSEGVSSRTRPGTKGVR
jgi:protein-tyrosine phosphatase